MTTKDAIPENTLTEEVKNDLNNIEETEKIANRKNLVYRANEYT